MKAFTSNAVTSGFRISKTHTTVLLLLLIITIASPIWAAKHIPPAPRDLAEVESILAQAPDVPDDQEVMHIVLLAGPKDHGPAGNNEHDYPLWQKCWKSLLSGQVEDVPSRINLYGDTAESGDRAGVPNVEVSTAWNWPSKEQLDTADVIVMFCAPKWNGETIEDLKS